MVRHHLLHPTIGQPHPLFVRGEGIELIDEAGQRYLDAASGVGVTCLGCSARPVAEAMQAQASRLPYVHLARFETPVTLALADAIADLAPDGLDHVVFTTGGSEANEADFKLARQYWVERGRPEKWRIVGRSPSFHGSTLATLSAGYHAARRAPHAPLLLDFPHITTPNLYRGCAHCRGACTLACADELDDVLLQVGPETVAAFVAEPVVGAAGGALAPPAGYFTRIREICDRHQILLIADEVLTGFGRVGRWFGSERVGLRPDLLTFGKGAAAGYAPLGGMVVRGDLVDAFGSGRFEHSFTMAGHPVSCAAGLATLQLLASEHLVEHVAQTEVAFFELLHGHLDEVPLVGDIRGLGFLAGVELVADRNSRQPFPPDRRVGAEAARCAFEEGLLVYACSGGIGHLAGDYLLLMPPFISSAEQLTAMAERLARALGKLADALS